MRPGRMLPLLLLVGALAGCGGSGPSKEPASAVPKGAVAVVGDETVSKEAFNTLIYQEQLQFALQKKAFPDQGTAAYDGVRDSVVSYLVHSAEFRQEAAKMGVKVSDDEVDKAVATLKQQHYGGDEQKYDQARYAQGLSEADVAANQRFQLLTDKLFQRVTKNTTVSDQELRDYYNSHESQFVSKDSRTVRHILVKTKAQADRLYDQLKAGASFVALEKKYTQDHGPGRLLMPISRGDTVPNFETVAFGLHIDQISKPVKTAAGWHVVQALTPIRKGTLQPFGKVKPEIRTQLRKSKQSDVMNTWMQGVQKSFCKAQITYAKAFVPLVDPCKSAALATTTTG